MAELFLLDKICPLNSLVVLDCNDEWIIYCFLEIDGGINLATFEISTGGIALAIIKQFVLAEGSLFMHNNIYRKMRQLQSELTCASSKENKFSVQIPENENDDRITDIFQNKSSLTCPCEGLTRYK